MDSAQSNPNMWPPLPLSAWKGTCRTLHMWTQMVGKVRLALAPPTNHWWDATLHLTARGLTTTPMRHRDRVFEIAFDFVDHVLRIDLDDGRRREIPLAAVPVATFYRRFLQALGDLGIDVHVWPVPVEVPDPIPFTSDASAEYDPEYARRFFHVLARAEAVLQRFRSGFVGKCSPVHFFWGSFDLAVTRFSGRPAPPRPEADPVTREAYSHEVTSAGFWPGSGAVPDAAFYAYAAPEPEGFRDAKIGPKEAFYSPEFKQFIYRYEDMRVAPDPEAALGEFLQSTYEAAADLGKWDRAALERARRP